MKVLSAIVAWMVVSLSVCGAQPLLSLQENFDQGTRALAGREFNKAEQLFQTGLESAQSAGEKVWSGRFEQSLGDVSMNQLRLKDASPHYERALALFEATANSAG